jgi:hypothetical protein
LLKIWAKILFCKHYFSPLNTFMRKGKDPDPELYLCLMDPDPGGQKHADPQHCLQHPPPEVSLPPIRAMLPISTTAPPEVSHQGREQDLPTGRRPQPPQDGQAMRHRHPRGLGRGHLNPGLAIKNPPKKIHPIKAQKTQ